MIEVKETSFINTDIVIVQMGVSKDEWEKIRASAEWQRILSSDISNENQFKSIHIDLEKKIFLLNGKPLNNVSQLKLEASDAHWSLALSRDERYEAPLQKSKD